MANPNNASFNPTMIEREIDFSREDYEAARAAQPIEHLDFDDFLEKVFDVTLGEMGSLEDAVFIANDAYQKLI